MPIDMKMLVFFLGKCVRAAAKTMVVDRKKNRRHYLCYIWRRGRCEMQQTQALCRPSSQQNRQPRWSPRRQILNLNFSPSTKKITEYSFGLFLSIINCLDFCCLCLNAGHHPISRQKTRETAQDLKCMPSHIGDPVVRTVTWLLRHYQNFLAW